MDEDLCYTPATELAGLLKDRKLAARELLRACLDRIERVNPQLNAIVTMDPERAMREAGEADQAAAGRGFRGPLHGLPVAVKDLADTAGMRTTYGSPIYADHVPEDDAPHVALLRNAGAIIVGKTNTPEFGVGAQTFNPVFGVTRNPYDRSLTCGGSSGGAAAAVAAGLVPFADGSDLAASVRNPAAMCGVTGLRTTPGLVPAGQPATDDIFDPQIVIGPIARTPADAALLLAGMRGRDRALPLARGWPGAERGRGPAAGLEVPALHGIRIAWSADLGGLPVERDVAEVIGLARKGLAESGAVITDAEPDLSDTDAVFQVTRALLVAGKFAPLLQTERERMKPALVWNIEKAFTMDGGQIAAAMRRRSEIFGRMKHFLSGYDVLALPTVQVAAFPVEQEWVSEINGVPQGSYLDWMRTCSRITVTGHPAVSVPAGLTAGGLPVGLQLVGRYGGDLRLLAIAEAVSRRLAPGGLRPAI